jgi:AcrR family transcriptional regulator
MAISKKNTTKVPRGRRPGANSTRGAVLEAARARFSSSGFTATTIRSVAADAGVDVAQVMQFFGSKDELFAAVMAVPASALNRFSTLFEGSDEQLGERVVRSFLKAWEGVPDESEPLMATLRGAVVNNQARDQLRDFIQSRLLTGAGKRLGSDAALRAGLASSLLVGLVVGRRIIGVPILASAKTEDLIKVLAPAIQKILVPETSVRSAD